jgi:sigma-E factor negative regulatory protein RseC
MQFGNNNDISCASRSGEIAKIESGNILINIMNASACAACHAKGVCSAFEQKEKTISVPYNMQNLQVGDRVNVYMKLSAGLKASLLAYALPAVVALGALLTLSATGVDELMTGGLSLGALALYYAGLYLFRNKLKKQFVFFIERID